VKVHHSHEATATKILEGVLERSFPARVEHGQAVAEQNEIEAGVGMDRFIVGAVKSLERVSQGLDFAACPLEHVLGDVETEELGTWKSAG
jgi:hypothetical protein